MKLRKKLFLSCAALAACATTLATTTYAWYTSNTEVSASGFTAGTTTGGDDTLLVSTTGNAGTWGSQVTLSNTKKLLPRSFGADGNGADSAFYPIHVDGYLDEADTSAAGYIEFDLFFKNPAKAGNIYVSEMTFANTTASAQPKGLLSTTGLSGVSAESVKTYSVDILRALGVVIKTSTVTANNADDTGVSFPTSTVLYKLDTETAHNPEVYNDILDSADSTGSAKAANTFASSTNAIQYYNAVTGKTLKLTEDGQAVATNPLLTQSIGTGSTNFDLGATLTTNIYKVTFIIFLNGWDLQCFDACQGQDFSLNMKFSTVSTNAIKLGEASAK